MIFQGPVSFFIISPVYRSYPAIGLSFTFSRGLIHCQTDGWFRIIYTLYIIYDSKWVSMGR